MKFKNISGQDLTIPDVGLVKANEIKEMPEGFNNANFEPVEKNKKKKVDEEESI